MAIQHHFGTGLLPTASGPDWRRGLPVLSDARVTLREVCVADGASLLAHLHGPEVSEHVATPPSTIEGFCRFIRWARRQRRHERHASFAVIPAGGVEAVGLIQVWPVEPDFQTVEWGAVVGPRYWGTDLFARCARLLFAYAFDDVGVQRIEARVSVNNERGHAALRKLGATREEVVRDSGRYPGHFEDHVIWSWLQRDWITQPSRRGAN